MTNQEALQEARRRWGSRAFAIVNKNGLLDVGVVTNPPPDWKGKWGGLKKLYGWGDTWEEAFELAEIRTKTP